MTEGPIAGWQVLKLIMGPTRNLDRKALRQLQAELKLLKQCDTWLDR